MELNDGRTLYAWLAKDFAGIEGLIMVPDRNGNPLPLVTVSRRVAMIGRRAAVKAGNARRETVRLVRFVEAEVVDEVEP